MLVVSQVCGGRYDPRDIGSRRERCEERLMGRTVSYAAVGMEERERVNVEKDMLYCCRNPLRYSYPN